ncbi:leucine-rich repeat-containing protein 27 [Dipodomys spectabilis]|uniref:leucine-rich repeat-containing protein 27 n=1 Tax=Dipodomys spectabilis TaxID=105255 RepID=UPI001C547493|nr:leucine-rich repeat-containing protein 27 [Dipodomys spectabilis]
MEACERPAKTRSLPASPYEEFHKDTEEVICPPDLILDLSNSGLSHVGEAFKIPNLQQLYLQRNALCTIPGDFFQRLPSLTWLDLRFNKIRVLPVGIGSHKHLKTLLLEKNPIKTLPVELGSVSTLKSLNLRHCPLEFPPQLIVQKGLLAILTFLRMCAVDRRSTDAAPPEAAPVKKTVLSELPALGVAPPQDPVSAKQAVSLPEAVQKEKDSFLPPVDRQDQDQVSIHSLEHWPSKEEIRRFWKLRQEIVENGKANLAGNQLLPVELPPNIQATLKTKERDYPPPRDVLRRKTAPFKSIFPALTSHYQAAMGGRRLEESRVFREIQEKQTLVEQRRRDRRTLQEWREQAQMKRRKQPSVLLPLQRNLVASKISLSTNLANQGQVPTNPLERMKHRKEKPMQESTDTKYAECPKGPSMCWESGPSPGGPGSRGLHLGASCSQPLPGDHRDLEGYLGPLQGRPDEIPPQGFSVLSAARLADLEERIRQHIKQLQAHRRLQGTDLLQEVRTAVQDLETAKKLQEEVMKLKQESTLNKGH